MTFEETGTSAFTCEPVVHLVVSDPELSPAIHAAVLASTDGKDCEVEVRTVPELRDIVRTQVKDNRCRLRWRFNQAAKAVTKASTLLTVTP